MGTLGGFVISGAETRAVLAGHVAGSAGLRVKARRGSHPHYDLGLVRKVVRRHDVACSGPVSPEAADALSAASTDVRDPRPSDVNTIVTVGVRREPHGLQAQITDVDATGYFPRPLPGLTAFESALTIDGDSGAPVRDYAGNVIGFVVGVSSGKTMIMPAGRAIDALR